MQVDLRVGGGTVGDLGICLFADCGDDDGKGVGACGVKQKKGKAAVAGDEAEDGRRIGRSAGYGHGECAWLRVEGLCGNEK